VVQTFSKSRSLAGLRIGFAIANKELIAVLNAVKNSYNSYTMNTLTIKAGSASIRDDSYFRETVSRIVATREKAKKDLSALGFEFKNSKSNFIFAKHKSISAVEIFNALREKHIFVRYFNQPRIDNYLRITVGTDQEMQALIDFLTNYIKSK
jgi:histidinol-phosphate aminotransferase